MDTNKNIKEFAQSIIATEKSAIENLGQYVDDDFAEIVRLIYSSQGRVIITGIGKSAIIGNKIVATLNSTGTPAIFMHAADAIHGDLGIIQSDDIIICISKSGTTPEVKVLVPLIRNIGSNKIIAMVGNLDSYLATSCDHIINTTVAHEACPNNLAPTSSTTAQLVMGDALAMSLLHLRGFSSADFAKVHPGGALGKKLYTRVADIMSTEEPPMVLPESALDDIIVEISSKRLGATAVVDSDGTLVGIITDGDLRRMLHRKVDFGSVRAADIMSAGPKTIEADELAVKAFNIMEDKKITQLLVVDNGKYAGVIHIHDILREGVV